MGGAGVGGWNRLGDVEALEEVARNLLADSKRHVFISFATEDINEVNLLRAQAESENSDIEFKDHSVRVPYDSERAEYVRRKLFERINRCTKTVVYLSVATTNSRWVKWEVERSLELGKSVIAVHPCKNYSGRLPRWLRRNGISVASWSNLAAEL